MALIDRLVAKVDRIRQRVNVEKVGVRRYRLYRVIRTWDGGEVGSGDATRSEMEITPAPAITLGRGKDVLSGRGRVERSTMRATEISLSYTEADLFPTLSAGQELYYRLVASRDQDQEVKYWILSANPEADRCETVTGNAQWILDFTQAQIEE